MKKKTTVPATSALASAAAPAEGAIQFRLPSVNTASQYYKDMAKFRKDDFVKLVNPLIDILKGKTVCETDKSSSGILKFLKHIISEQDADILKKDQLVELYCSFTSELCNIYSLASADPQLKTFWKRMIMTPQVTSGQIHDVSARKIVVLERYYWDDSYFFQDCAFYPLRCLGSPNRWSWDREVKTSQIFSLEPDTRRELFGLFYDKGLLEPSVTEELPETGEFQICNFEKSLGPDLLYFNGLALTGSPLAPSTGAVSAAKLKAIKKSLTSDAFPSMGEKYPLDRIELLTWAYFTMRMHLKKDKDNITPGLFASKLIDRLPTCVVGKVFEAFMPAFKGFNKSWTSDNDVAEVAGAIYELIRPAAQGWMSLSNLKIRFLCTDDGYKTANSYLKLFPKLRISYVILTRKTDADAGEETNVQNINWFNEIEFPFILHWIEFLCAVGIVEIAYAKDSADANDDPLEGMRYVRLTPLGRYAFGIDKEYRAPEAAEAYQLEYDDANAIITVLSHNCPYTVFLAQVCRPIGTSRFRISPETLIHGCDNKAQVEERIKKLRLIIPVDKHPWLQSIVEETQKRITAITPNKTKYKILKIGADNPALIRSLTANKEIRENCRFAEGSLLLVPSTFLDRFRAIALTLGYLPET